MQQPRQTTLLPALPGAVVLFLEHVCAAFLASLFPVFPLLLSYQSREGQERALLSSPGGPGGSSEAAGTGR